MDKMTPEEVELIKKYGFALLPPRIERRDEKEEKKLEAVPASYAVQCQVCGRMGIMTMEEMKNHQMSHVDKPFGQS